jgi:hypothetical protein
MEFGGGALAPEASLSASSRLLSRREDEIYDRLNGDPHAWLSSFV